MKKYWLLFWWANLLSLFSLIALSFWEYVNHSSAYDYSFAGVWIFAVAMAALFLMMLRQSDYKEGSVLWPWRMAIFLWFVLLVVIGYQKNWSLWSLLIPLLVYVASGELSVKNKKTS